MDARALGDKLIAPALAGLAALVCVSVIIAMTLAASAQVDRPIGREQPQVTGITEPGSFLCDRTQGGALGCQPTPLLPCGSPVPIRGGSETMAHQYCESRISERVQDDPARNSFPRRNAIVSCMRTWRQSNQGRLSAPAFAQVDRPVSQVNRPMGQVKRQAALDTPPIEQQNPEVTGIAEATSYFCDWSKNGTINCEPTPVLSCGTSKHMTIDSETMARQNCEELVPQRVQDDPERNAFPRKNAIAGCLSRWRMSRQHLLMPSNSRSLAH
jgi:hypothetical protein